METIRQSLREPIYNEMLLDVLSMVENNEGVLTIVLNGKSNIVVGDKIRFSRIVSSEEFDRNETVAEQVMTVEKVVRKKDSTEIKMIAPKRKSGFIERIEKLDKNGIGMYGNENPVAWRKLVFTEDVNLFAQDVASGDIELIPIAGGGEQEHISSYTLAERLSITHTDDIGVDAKDFLLKKELIQDVLCEDGEPTISGVSQEYYYVPERLVTNAIFLPDGYDESILERGGVYIEFSQNEFYHKDSDGVCMFWDDYNSMKFKNKEYNQTDYANNEKERNIITASWITSYWRINVGFQPDTDTTHLYQEALVNDMFVKKVKESLSTPVINMEKIKFQPAIKNADGTFTEASAVTYNMHFRVRDEETWDYVTKGDIWNGISTYDSITKENAELSDLVGYLGFTDNDIRYQKMKVAKSFIRMTYYDSNDFINGAVLGYSTIFMDSGSLFGKYVKIRNYMAKNGYSVDDIDNPYAVTTFSGCTDRVDSQFTVRNEFYYDKSSEGFNIYYFATDAPLENETKTIYMRVEFNHAGFGRTIPMINCSGVNTLTLNKYKSGLYIPIKLTHINGKYYYYVEDDGPCIINDKDNTTIKFNLFEPKL